MQPLNEETIKSNKVIVNQTTTQSTKLYLSGSLMYVVKNMKQKSYKKVINVALTKVNSCHTLGIIFFKAI